MTTMTPRWWRPAPLVWRSDAWSLEVRDDELADIRRGDRVLLRAIRAVVRDRSWNTVPASVLATGITEESLTLRLRHTGFGVELVSTLIVHATAERLTVEWDAQNLRAFETCRTGLVVLHPASDSGRPITVRHSNGAEEETVFPMRISPHQPIVDIRELRIGDAGSITHLRFDGEVFEMEDQRNWSDASFKTYSRPLALPYPYPLAAGEQVRQAITLSAENSARGPVEMEPVTITLQEGGAFPLIGVEASTAPGTAPTDIVEQAGHFRIVELDLRTPTWSAALARAARDELPLDVRLVLPEDQDPLVAASAALAQHRVLAVTPFDPASHISDAPAVARTRSALAAAGCTCEVRGGSRSHFTEFNRETHRIPDDLDAIVVTTTPLFHALDTEQLIESVPMQRLIATQTIEMAHDRPVHIGPVSLRPRFNDVATDSQPAPTRSDLAEGYGAHFTGSDDDRQGAVELAAWTIASAAAFAVPGTHSVAWFETWGPRGLWDSDGVARPSAAAIRALTALSRHTLLWAKHTDDLVWAVGGRTAAEDIVLVANLGKSAREVQIRCADDTRVHEVRIGPGSWEQLVLPRR